MWGCNVGYPFGYGNWFWGHGIFGLTVSLLLMLLFISLIAFMLRLLTNKSRINRDTSDSMLIIQTKYAAGEISEDEYRRMREILRN